MEVYFAEFQQDGWTLQLGWQVFEECPDTAPLLQTNQAEISVTHCDENGLTCDPRDLLSAPTLGGCHPSIAVDYGLSGPDYPDPREELRDARVPGVQHDPIFGRSKSYTGLPFHIAKPDGSKDHFHIKCEGSKISTLCAFVRLTRAWFGAGEGKLRLSPNGLWVFSSQADDGARLYVDRDNDGVVRDNENVLDHWDQCCVTHSSSPIPLAGSELTIRYEMHDVAGRSYAFLSYADVQRLSPPYVAGEGSFVATSTISQGTDDFEIVAWSSSLDDGHYVGGRASNDNMAVPTTPPTATSMAPYPWNGEDATYASRSSPSLHLGRHGDTSAVVLIFRDLKIPSGVSIQSATISFSHKPEESSQIQGGSALSLSIRAVLPGNQEPAHRPEAPVGWIDLADHARGRIQTRVTQSGISAVPPNPAFDRPLTSAAAVWSLDATAAQQEHGYDIFSDRITSVDIKDVVSEVVRSPWRSGQPIELVISAGFGNGGLGVSSFEGHPHKAPMLTVVVG